MQSTFQYSLELHPDTILYVSPFYYFHLCLHILYYISNPHAFTLVRDILSWLVPNTFLPVYAQVLE